MFLHDSGSFKTYFTFFFLSFFFGGVPYIIIGEVQLGEILSGSGAVEHRLYTYVREERGSVMRRKYQGA